MPTIVCLNGGSSSLKYAIYRVEAGSEAPLAIATGVLPASGDADAVVEAVFAKVLKGAEPAAVGHRIVFGGPGHSDPVRANDPVLRGLEEFVDVEPLHLRAELDLVYAVGRHYPSLLQVLCFDTAFHRRSPAIAHRLPLPGDLDPIVARYGFHGLSYEYVSSQLRDRSGLTVIGHLGSGASLCALRDREPIDTTMGFSALGGLMMGTRPGDLDPGIALWLLRHDGYDLERLSDLLYHRSGLLGVSGITADMKTLMKSATSDRRACEAVELFIYQLRKNLGAMIAVLGGLDTLVFTGGIGEQAAPIRAKACAGFEFLGIRLDEAANQRNERVISQAGSPVVVEVIPTDENLAIARHVTALM
ncbi:MAG: acetate/propionate family kinase, partial [Candidatus Eremiobacteraeota bacterium]|nr:acetate/propionate family kinase [Candidatus Eremiobacteraeota bacterium]